MFKDSSANKLIEYIQSLPAKEQKLIVKGITHAKGNSRKVKSVISPKKKEGIAQMGAFLDSLGHKLPKNFKFTREEANER